MVAVFTAAREKKLHPFVSVPNGSFVKSSTVIDSFCVGGGTEGVDPNPEYFPP